MSAQDMFSWYKNLYSDVENSAAYSKYCGIVFGNDFSKQGFSDKAQIDFMLSKLEITEPCTVLDIGCGTGKLDEYIYDLTGASITGLDYSPTAIQIAKKRTHGKPSLSFIVGDMDSVDYPVNSFDIIFFVDAIFFSSDLPKLLLKLNELLKDNGKLAIYYSEIRFDKNVNVDILLPENTQVGKALENAGLKYSFFDHTDNLYSHMRLKQKTAVALKKDFMDEEKEYLFDYIFRESISEDMSMVDFKEFQARYLFLCEKQ